MWWLHRVSYRSAGWRKKKCVTQDLHKTINQGSILALKSLIKAPLSYTTKKLHNQSAFRKHAVEQAKFRNKTTALVFAEISQTGTLSNYYLPVFTLN